MIFFATMSMYACIYLCMDIYIYVYVIQRRGAYFRERSSLFMPRFLPENQFQELAFLKYLKMAKVPLNEYEFPSSKIANVQSQVR